MYNKLFTNVDLAHIDWAKDDRAALLRTLQSVKLPLKGPAVSSGWGELAVDPDPRSVRRSLARRGDLRTTWWNFYSSIYLRFVPHASLEAAMYSFHHLHHGLTMARLEFWDSVTRTSNDVQRAGVLTALRNSILRELKR